MAKTAKHSSSGSRLLVVLPAIFIVGLLLAIGFECPEFLSRGGTLSKICFLPVRAVEVFHKIGEALMIAAVLAAIVDEDLKGQLIADADRFTSGRNLPSELREYLHDCLTSPLVRSRWDITYTIERWPAKPGYVKLTTRSAYQMENHSRHRAHYDFVYEVEKSLYPEIGETEITAVEIPETGRVTGATLAAEILLENEFFRYPKTPQSLKLKPLKSKQTYEFASESVECFRDTQYSYFWATYPVMLTTLTVIHEKTDFRVSLELTFDKNDVARQEDVPNGTKWTINQPILPGQGFVTRWDPQLPPI
jgi:hypothetical protein